MDAIAAIAFSMIVVNAVKQLASRTPTNFQTNTISWNYCCSSTYVYLYFLGFIGNHMAVPQEKVASLIANDEILVHIY